MIPVLRRLTSPATFLALVTLLAMMLMAQYLPATLLPDTAHSFGTEERNVAWCSFGMFAGCAIGASLLSKPPLIPWAVLAMGYGLLAMAVAPSAWTFVGASVLLGLGLGIWSALQSAIDRWAAGPRAALITGLVPVIAFGLMALLRWTLVAIAAHAGWTTAYFVLAALMIPTCGLAVWVFVREPVAAQPQAAASSRGNGPKPARRVVFWGALTAGATSLALSPFDLFEATAMRQQGEGAAIGPVSLAFFFGAAIASALMALMRDRERRAILTGALLTLGAAIVALLNLTSLMEANQAAGFLAARTMIEAGTCIITFSLSGMFGRRFGHFEVFSRAFITSKALFSSVGFVINPLLYGDDHWARALCVSVVGGALLLGGAVQSARILREGPAQTWTRTEDELLELLRRGSLAAAA